MSFDPQAFVTPYVSLDEVLEIKKAFDLFDRDLGGAIDPRGMHTMSQNLRSPSILSVSKPKLRQSIR